MLNKKVLIYNTRFILQKIIMACDYYIYTYLYIFFQTQTQTQPNNENIKSYVSISLPYQKGYFNDNDDDDADEVSLIPNKPIIIYSKNKFESKTYEENYKNIVQDKLNTIDKKWENITMIKIIERRFERF